MTVIKKIQLWQWIQITVWLLGAAGVIWAVSGDRTEALNRISGVEDATRANAARNAKIEAELRSFQDTTNMYLSDIRQNLATINNNISWIRGSLDPAHRRESD